MSKFRNIDWIMFLSTLPLMGAGLMAMKTLGAGDDYFFSRQIVWISISFAVFFIFSFYDWRFLKNGALVLSLYIIGLVMLALPLLAAGPVRGAQSWIRVFSFSVEPSDPMKILLILVLAKYFSRRHIEIARIKHIFISAVYALLPIFIAILQPDFGSVIIFSFIWLGMILVSGVNKRHLLMIFLLGIILVSITWFFVLHPYQKLRIATFLDPLRDPRGAGYNALQSIIAVGSGKIFGKGIGYGAQSRLGFLPEHETDFIFAAFAEEWGFLGVFPIFIFFGILIWRILLNSFYGRGNFERLFGIGLSLLIIIQFSIHIGMNTGVLPITGISLPFMSYGGSHLLTIFVGLGILMGMRRHGYSAALQS